MRSPLDALVALVASRDLVATAKLACADDPSTTLSALTVAIVHFAREQREVSMIEALDIAIGGLQHARARRVARDAAQASAEPAVEGAIPS